MIKVIKDIVEAIFTILLWITMGILVFGVYLYVTEQKEKKEQLAAAEYAAERAWKDPLINNCKNGVRARADPGTLSFRNPGDPFSRHVSDTIQKTDSGYLYVMLASDATTRNGPITFHCYTNQQGQVVRLVDRGR